MGNSKQFDRFTLTKTHKISSTDEGITESIQIDGSHLWEVVWDMAMKDAQEIIKQYISDEECWIKSESITMIYLFVGKANIYVYELHPMK